VANRLRRRASQTTRARNSSKPTVITGVTPDSTVVRKEIFGSVLSAFTSSDEDEAIRLANATR
jgi:acyl-CoA reductase-like NAD-dependent aldehyde dehydrogenase